MTTYDNIVRNDSLVMANKDKQIAIYDQKLIDCAAALGKEQKKTGRLKKLIWGLVGILSIETIIILIK